MGHLRELKSFLEIGHSRLKLGVLCLDGQAVPTLHLFESQHRILRRGQHNSVVELAESITTLVNRASRVINQRLETCTILPPNNLAATESIRPSLLLNDAIVSSAHEQLLREQATTLFADDQREIIDVEFQNWFLDHLSSSAFPLGRRGQKLEVQCLAVSYDKCILSDYVSACNQAGLKVERFSSGFLAASGFIRELGAAASNQVIIDLGDSITSGILQISGQTSGAFSVLAGSNHMTRDICAALQISDREAESLKRHIGLALVSPTKNMLLSAGSHSESQEGVGCSTNAVIYPWLAPRVAEILDLSRRNFAVYLRALDGGIVFIGGGSQLPGLSSFAVQRFSGVKVTIFKPTLDGVAAALRAKIIPHATADLSGFESIFGLSSRMIREQLERRVARNSSMRLFRPLWTWLGDLSK